MPDIELTAVTSRSSFAIAPEIRQVRLPFRTDGIFGRLTADHFHPLLCNPRASLWHYPKGFLPLHLPRRARIVGTVHDTILQFYADRYPETRSRTDFTYWLWLLKRSLAKADLVLTISEFSKRSIEEFCKRHRLRCPLLRVTYEGARFEETVETPHATKGDYVIHLASPLPHKKTRWLLEMWRQLQRDGRALPPLKLIGTLPPDAAGIAAQLAHVTMMPPLSSDALARSFAEARALLLPSEIEGFGLPAVESYYLGTPVAFVKGTAVEEVLGSSAPGGFHFERSSFAQALDDILGMPPSTVRARADELRQKFSWAACLQRTVDAYRLVT